MVGKNKISTEKTKLTNLCVDFEEMNFFGEYVIEPFVQQCAIMLNKCTQPFVQQCAIILYKYTQPFVQHCAIMLYKYTQHFVQQCAIKSNYTNKYSQPFVQQCAIMLNKYHKRWHYHKYKKLDFMPFSKKQRIPNLYSKPQFMKLAGL